MNIRPLPFVIAASDMGTMIVPRNDYKMTSPTSGIGVGFEILNNGACSIGDVMLVKDVARRLHASRRNSIIMFDIGANIGVFTVALAREMHGWGAVMAFEPQEQIYYALSGNIAINGCINARAFHAAVGTTSGSMRIPIADIYVPGSYGSLELRKRDTTEDIGQPIDYEKNLATVAVIAIDSMSPSAADLMKIDVEGMELEVLEGAAHTIAKYRPVMFIEALKTDRAELENMLDEFGYVWRYRDINVLAVHRDDPLVSIFESTTDDAPAKG